MKKLLYLLPLTLLIFGCQPATSTTPPAALAPGYSSTADQQFGQALAAAHAFALQATADYGKLTPTQQATEKNALNGFIAAVNAADTVYSDFHRGLVAASDVQAQLAKVSAAQAAYAAVSTEGHAAGPSKYVDIIATGDCPGCEGGIVAIGEKGGK